MAKGKKNELKAVSAEPLDSIDDSKKKDAKDDKQAAGEVTDKEEVSESKESKDAPIEDIPLDDKDAANNDSSKDDEKVTTTEKTKPSAEEEEEEESSESAPPPPPPKRPKDPVEQIVQDLKDAFPQTDDKVITAVLIASQGNPEPAFGALLYLSDPTFKPDIPVYPQHQPASNPRAAFGSGLVRSRAPSDTSHTFTDDEILARKLQKEFELEDERQRRRREEKARQRQFHGERSSRGGAAGGAGGVSAGGSRSSRERERPSRRVRRGEDGEEYYDDFDESPDEFETIKETFTQGLEEARTTINGWVSGLAKKFDNASGNNKDAGRYERADDDYDYDYDDDDDRRNRQSGRGGHQQRPSSGRPPRQQFGSKSHRDGGNNFGNLGGGRYYDDWRHKNNRTRFDEDPEIITGDFQDQITITDKDSQKLDDAKKKGKAGGSGGAAATSQKKDGKGAGEEEEDPEHTPNLPRRPRMSSDVVDETRKGPGSGATATSGNKTADAGAATTTNNAFSVDDSDDEDENNNLVKSG
ncbi:CUE5 [Candida metapsilosis]|uniref:CUE5 n=1 Tax=Candida metapsilosis TaxID=273372 RepID=A0A8H8DEP9_9ASCO|nr:CUE5 [Candida metapsilosis]